MSYIPIGMLGIDRVTAVMAARGWRFDQLSKLTAEQRRELRAAQLSAMPPKVRAAFDEANEQRRREVLAAAAFEEAHQHRAVVMAASRPTGSAPGARHGFSQESSSMQTTLSATQLAAASAITARINQPLNQGELDVCRLLGLSEAAYLEQRNNDLLKELPEGTGAIDGHVALDAADRSVCRALGLSEVSYLEQKRIEHDRAQALSR